MLDLRTTTSLFLVVTALQLRAQAPVVVMSDASYNYCSATFLDPGGTGSYPDAVYYSTTFCPGNNGEDPNSVSQIYFADFDLGYGDNVYIHAGPDAGWDLIAIGSNGNSLAGSVFAGQAWNGGCLTVVFVSDAAFPGMGWTAQVSCSTPCTPPTAVVQPTGYLEVCPGQPITLDGSASTSGSYGIESYLWTLPPGGIANGATADLDPTEGGQFSVDLMVMDALGCMSQSPASVVVRVPTTPDFSQITTVADMPCAGQEVVLSGQVVGEEWTSAPQPTVAGETPLPDGGGTSYVSTVQATGFAPGAVVTAASDLVEVCMVIEHSYIGDLTVTLTAPGGQQVVVFDGNGGGGGGTYLGAPIDYFGSNGLPGVGAQYCFSMSAAWGTLLAEDLMGNHVMAGNPPSLSMTPGSYQPGSSFLNLIGSPLNGGWVLTVTDHMLADDGFIFAWWLNFDPALYPDVVTFTPQYPTGSYQWSGPGVGATAPDGSAAAEPPAEGENVYTLSVIDDLGCAWDTSFSVVVGPPVFDLLPATADFCTSQGPQALVDHLTPAEAGAVVPATGTWTGPGGGAFSGTFDPATGTPGTYTYVLGAGTDCSSSGTVEVTVATLPNAGNDTPLTYCSSVPPIALFPLLNGTPDQGGTWEMPDGSTFDGVFVPGEMPSGDYLHIQVGTANCPSDTAVVSVVVQQDVDAGENASIALCADADLFSLVASLGGTPDQSGTWQAPGGLPVADLLDPAVAVSGVYTYTVDGALPCPDRTATLTVHVDARPHAGVGDSLSFCSNANPASLFLALDDDPDAGGQWTDPAGSPNPGVVVPSEQLSGPYRYVVTGAGLCAHLVDSTVVEVLVRPAPAVDFLAVVDSGCHPLQVVFTNTTPAEDVGGDCIWHLGDATAPIASCGPVEHTYDVPGIYTVTLRVVSPIGCAAELQVPGAIVVEPAPTADFVFTPDPATNEVSTVVFSATDPQATVFHWNFHDGDTLTGRQVTRRYPSALSGVYEVCLDVLDRFGCADTLCRTVRMEVPSLFIPNAFSPNGDGHNELFQPFIDGFAKDGFIWRIFDRWGHIVFESDDPAAAWKGEHRTGGGLMPDGVYVWEVSGRPLYSPNTIERKGTVTLIK